MPAKNRFGALKEIRAERQVEEAASKEIESPQDVATESDASQSPSSEIDTQKSSKPHPGSKPQKGQGAARLA